MRRTLRVDATNCRMARWDRGSLLMIYQAAARFVFTLPSANLFRLISTLKALSPSSSRPCTTCVFRSIWLLRVVVELSRSSFTASLSHDWKASMVSERYGIDIAELVVYILLLPLSLFVAVRHGFSRSAGYLYLCLFCGIRIANSAVGILSEKNPGDRTV